MKDIKIQKDAPCCEQCGSTDIEIDAVISWNSGAQDWQIDTKWDTGYCCKCEDTFKSWGTLHQWEVDNS